MEDSLINVDVIYPATDKHVLKHSTQQYYMVLSPLPLSLRDHAAKSGKPSQARGAMNVPLGLLQLSGTPDVSKLHLRSGTQSG